MFVEGKENLEGSLWNAQGKQQESLLIVFMYKYFFAKGFG